MAIKWLIIRRETPSSKCDTARSRIIDVSLLVSVRMSAVEQPADLILLIFGSGGRFMHFLLRRVATAKYGVCPNDRKTPGYSTAGHWLNRHSRRPDMEAQVHAGTCRTLPPTCIRCAYEQEAMETCARRMMWSNFRSRRRFEQYAVSSASCHWHRTESRYIIVYRQLLMNAGTIDHKRVRKLRTIRQAQH